MTPAGRTVRIIASAALCLGLAWGTLRGQDDHFPIGPLRMYSTRQRLDGSISWYQVRAVGSDGVERFVSGAELGMRRAEVEGQVLRFVAQPDLLCVLGRDLDGDVHEVRLVRMSRPLEDGRPTGETSEELRASCRL